MDIYEIRQELSAGRTIFELPLRVAYYARVSTDKEEQLHSLSAQVNYYRDFIGACAGWQLVEGYVDEGISGTSVRRRENFLRMIRDAKAQKFDFLVTKEISRFSRSTLDSIRYTQELLQAGVGVLFQSDNINTLMPDAELRLTIMASIAQDEVRKISERVKFGFRRAIESGVVLGSSRIWGYRKQEGRLIIDEEEAGIVRTIFDLYANERLGIRTIAARLQEQGVCNTNGNPFSFSTIRGILSNPKYKGYYCGGKSTRVDYKLNTVKNFPQEEWVLYEDPEKVPPIVTEELWERANRLLKSRAEKQRSKDPCGYQNRYPYSGKIFCGTHKAPFYRAVYHMPSGGKEVWQCRIYVKEGRKGCEAPKLYSEEANSVLRNLWAHCGLGAEEIAETLLKLYASASQTPGLSEAILKCGRELEEVLRRQDRLLDLNLGGIISSEEFRLRNDRFTRLSRELQARRAELEAERKRGLALAEDPDQLRAAIRKELRFESGFTAGSVDALLERIEVLPQTDRNTVSLMVLPRGSEKALPCTIRRTRGKPSVCTGPYI